MATPAYRYFGLVGDPVIDGISHGYYWGLNNDRTVDWSISDGFSGEYWVNPGEKPSLMQSMLDTYSYFANIKFNYVGYYKTPVVAVQYGSEINFSLSGSDFFSSKYTWAIGHFPTLAHESKYRGQGGDIFLNIYSQANSLSSYAPGSAGWFVFMHEIGHVLGLKHPHDNGGTGRPTLSQLGLADMDVDWATIMSYADDFNWNTRLWDPATPMILDVLGLQYIYGKNMSSNAGDTTFQLAQTNFYQTLWDASGNDTVSAAGSSSGWTIHLPDKQLSQLVDTKVGLASVSSEFSLTSPRTLYWLAGTLENAIGGNGDDSIFGSNDGNSLQGGGGNDALHGGAGNDTFDHVSANRAGNDTFHGGTGDDVFFLDSAGDQVIEYAGEGSDTIWAGFNFSLASNPHIENLRALGSSGLKLTGNGNGNTISGTTGNDLIDGGGGIDLLLGSASRSNYTLSKSASGWQLSSYFEGSDKLLNVERLQFSDKKLALDLNPSEHGGQALEFIGLLAPNLIKTPSVVGNILKIFDDGYSMRGICQLALDTGLVKSISGSNSNAALAAMAFRNLIGSEADAGTINMLSGYMDGRFAHYSQAEFMAVIAGLDVNQAHIGLVGLQQTGVEYL